MKKEKELKDTYIEYLPDNKKKKVSNVMLFVIVVAIIGYVIADFILQYRMGIEISSTITTCWFAFWGTEIIALTGIKMSKVKHGTSDILDVMPDAEYTSDEEACG